MDLWDPPSPPPRPTPTRLSSIVADLELDVKNWKAPDEAFFKFYKYVDLPGLKIWFSKV